MGHSGLVLRSRCIGPGRARIQIIFIHSRSDITCTEPAEDYAFFYGKMNEIHKFEAEMFRK
jgi:hypothetical protein